MKRAFEYTDRPKESYVNRAKDRDSRKEGIFKGNFQFFTPKDGYNKIRILPPTWDNPDHYGIDVFVHYKIGDASSAFLCLKKMHDKPCPICERLKDPEVKADKTFSDAVGVKRKVLIWLIDRADETTGPKLWMMPSSIDRQYVLQSTDEEDNESLLRIDHPEIGYDVSFEKHGKDLQTKYEGEKIARKKSLLSEDPKLMEKWLEFICENPLPEVLDFKDYKHIKTVFEGGLVPVKEEEEEDDVPDPKEEIKKPEPKEPVTYDRDDLIDRAVEAGYKMKEIKNLSDKELAELLENDEDAVKQESEPAVDLEAIKKRINNKKYGEQK